MFKQSFWLMLGIFMIVTGVYNCFGGPHAWGLQSPSWGSTAGFLWFVMFHLFFGSIFINKWLDLRSNG